jgi:hypothetical protein
LNNAQVFLQLPVGLELPVALDIDVPIDEELDVALDVRAIIPLQQTQLHDPINNLRLLFEPIVRILDNLPSDFNGALTMVGDVLGGNAPNLLADTPYSLDPWVGFSRTAGVGYDLGEEPWPMLNQPVETGIVQQGGIPALDEQLRPDIYEQGGPAEVNQLAVEDMTDLGVPRYFYDGSYSLFSLGLLPQTAPPDAAAPSEGSTQGDRGGSAPPESEPLVPPPESTAETAPGG